MGPLDCSITIGAERWDQHWRLSVVSKRQEPGGEGQEPIQYRHRSAVYQLVPFPQVALTSPGEKEEEDSHCCCEPRVCTEQQQWTARLTDQPTSSQPKCLAT